MQPFHGILPALVTPLDSAGNLKPAVLERLIQHLYEAGVDGLYVAGNTGEGRDLPVATREALVEMAIRNSPPGKQVIVHVGAYQLADARRLARHAYQHGAAAISSLPPGPQYNFSETCFWYESLAGAAAIPLIVYHFPSLGPPLQLGQLESLLELPQVVGIKFTSFDLYTLRQLVATGKVVFNGHDEVLAAGLLMGAHGGIGSTYNLMPELFVKLYSQASTGRWKESIETQDRINGLIRLLLGFPFLPALKQVLDWQGFDCGAAVAPRAGLSAEQEQNLRQGFEAWLAS